MPTPADPPPSILSHVSIDTNDYPRAKAFYDAVLATLQIGGVMKHAGIAVAYGRAFPEFWVGLPNDGSKAVVGNDSHLGFLGRRSRRCFGTRRQDDPAGAWLHRC